MEGISKDYIKNAITELVDSLGVKESIPAESVLRPLNSGKPKECIEAIANQLGLPIRVNLAVSDRFVSSQLVSTHGATVGSTGITAQVSIPANLPLYGTPGLQGFPVSVTMSSNSHKHPQAFVAIMAHELCHVLLHSLPHREKSNEVYTDLAAMILGFSRIMQYGRKAAETRHHGTFSETTTTTYGHLSDEQFDFALRLVMKILSEEWSRLNDLRAGALKNLNACMKRIRSYRKMLCELDALVECLDKDPYRKIRKEDVPRVVEMHRPGYIDDFASLLTNMEKRVEGIRSLYAERLHHPQHHYTTRRLDSLRGFHTNLEGLMSRCDDEFTLLQNDLAVLRRCVGIWDRWRVRRQVRSMG